jgi:hypothetical protein
VLTTGIRVDDGSARARPELILYGLGAATEERQVNDEAAQTDSDMGPQSPMVGAGENSDQTGEEEDIGTANLGSQLPPQNVSESYSGPKISGRFTIFWSRDDRSKPTESAVIGSQHALSNLKDFRPRFEGFVGAFIFHAKRISIGSLRNRWTRPDESPHRRQHGAFKRILTWVPEVMSDLPREMT